jgi:5-methylcytosine-specific restriction endonuclease McrA
MGQAFLNLSYKKTKRYRRSVGHAFSSLIIKRDNYHCVKCKKEEDLISHHIIPVNINPNRIDDETNMVALCRECHLKAHNGYYKGPVNKEIQKELQNYIDHLDHSIFENYA